MPRKGVKGILRDAIGLSKVLGSRGILWDTIARITKVILCLLGTTSRIIKSPGNSKLF